MLLMNWAYMVYHKILEHKIGVGYVFWATVKNLELLVELQFQVYLNNIQQV